MSTPKETLPTAESEVSAAPCSAVSELVLPRRRWRLELYIGADTMEDLRGAFKGIQLDLFVNHCNSATGGGGGAGWHFELKEQNPTMTAEGYAAALEEYFDAMKRQNDQAETRRKTDNEKH